VLFLDLDDFKDINDSLGHGAGDALLHLVAERLHESVRPGDVVARLGGDEFAVLLEGLPDSATAQAVAERAVQSLAVPATFSGHRVHVGASIGLAMRHETSNPDSIMREADVAMYAAKSEGKNRVVRYESALDDGAGVVQLLKAELLDAAARGELVLEYQPLVELMTGRMLGVEALVRWQHPVRGLLTPAEFIPIAEQTGAIANIGEWVLETACRQVGVWQQVHLLPDFDLSVNISVRQLDQADFAEQVSAVLARTRFDPRRLILEITESVFADPRGDAAKILAAIRQCGVRVAIDDFGTGHASIQYLRQLPVDILKVDRSFVSGAEAEAHEVLLDAIVGLGQRLGLNVIPEGIEETDQLIRLQDLGCRTGQGFLLTRPSAPEVIGALLTHSTLLPSPRAHRDGLPVLPQAA
jgi:diguanylate cyclase (GGDEF)-like protein